MRVQWPLVWLLTGIAAQAATPELGKERLRQLVRLPAIAFQSDWRFDPEHGFTLGSAGQDARAQLSDLRKQLTGELSDAEMDEEMAELYGSLNDRVSARAAWNRAEGHYRKRVELQPENGRLLAGLGRALQETGKTQEAESVLRRAVEVTPKGWEGWVALGRFLDTEARAGLTARPAPSARGRGAAVPPATPSGPVKPSSGEVMLAQKRMAEAGECYDKAVTSAPEEAEGYFRRGMHRCLQTYLLNQVRHASGEEDVEVFSDCFSVESLADLQRASELSPRDYGRIGATALFEIYSVCAKKGQMDWGNFSWDSLPDQPQRWLREAMARLENLAQSPETRLAAGASETLGILQGAVLHEGRRCIANLQRALALDPSREQAWDTLAGTLAQAQRFDELLTECEAQVKQRDTARNHVLMAKAYEKLKQWENCEEEARTAADLDTNNFTASLAVGSLLLKRSQGDDDALDEANTWLTKAEAIMTKMPRTQRTQPQIIELTLNRSIFFALADQVDTAREWAKAVISVDKDNQLAREILSAMDY